MKSLAFKGVTVAILLMLAGGLVQAATSYQMTRDVTIPTTVGDGAVTASLIDNAGGIAYYATTGHGIKIVKFQLPAMTRIEAVSLPSVTESLTTGVLDPSQPYAYFGLNSTTAAKIIKVHLPDCTVVQQLVLTSGETTIADAAIDAVNGHVYFRVLAPTVSQRIVKVDTTSLGIVDSWPFDLATGQVTFFVLDAVHGFSYAYNTGTGSPAPFLTKINNADGSIAAQLLLPGAGIDGGVMDAGHDTLYLIHQQIPGVSGFLNVFVNRLRTNTMTLDSSVAGTYPLLIGIGGGGGTPTFTFTQLDSSILDKTHDYLYFSIVDQTTSSGNAIFQVDLASFAGIRAPGVAISPSVKNLQMDENANHLFGISQGNVVQVDTTTLTQTNSFPFLADGAHLASAAFDSSHNKVYFGTTFMQQGEIFEISIPAATLSRTLPLGFASSNLTTAFVDPSHQTLYVGNGITSHFSTIALPAFSSAQSFALSGTGPSSVGSSVVDTAAGYAYLGVTGLPGASHQIVRVSLANPMLQQTLYLTDANSPLNTAVIDPIHQMAYFGSSNNGAGSAGKIYSINLNTFALAGTLQSDPDQNFKASVIDVNAGYAYFGTESTLAAPPVKILKIKLADFTIANQLTLSSGEVGIWTATIDPASGFAYFGAVRYPVIAVGSQAPDIVEIRLADFSQVASIDLTDSTENPTASILDTANNHLYLGTQGGFPAASVIRLALSPTTSAPAAPTNVILSNPQATTLDLTWNASFGADGYRLDVALDSGFTTFAPGYQDKDLGNIPNFTITGLSPGTPYFVQMRAYNTAGTSASAASTPASLSTLSSTASKYDMKVISTGTLTGSPFVIVTDTLAGFSYSASFSGGVGGPISIVKTQLSNLQQVGVLSVPGVTGNATAAVIDPAGGFAYFAVTNAGHPAEIVQIDLSTFHVAATLTMATQETSLDSAAIDPVHGFAYFTTTLSGPVVRVIKIQLSPFSRVNTLVLPPGPGSATVALIDPTDNFLYLRSYPNFIVKIQLSTFLEVGALATPSGQFINSAMAIDPVSNFLYFGVTDFNAQVISARRADLNTFTLAPERLDFRTAYGMNSSFNSIVLDAANGFGYFYLEDNPSRLIEVRLVDLSFANSLMETNVFFHTISALVGQSLYVYASEGVTPELLNVKLTPDFDLPHPLLIALDPTSVHIGSPDFTLNAHGTNFQNGAQMTWNGVSLPTTYDAVYQLHATIPASDVTALGIDTVTVINPDGRASEMVQFVVTPQPPPSLSYLLPGTTSAASPDFILHVNGSNFVSGATVTWNNANRPTTYVNSSELDAAISHNDVAAVGTNNVAVINQDGQPSNVLTFNVTVALQPVIYTLSKTLVTVGSSGFTLKVIGDQFLNGAAVSWAGTTRTTTYVNGQELDIDLSDADLSVAGHYTINVVNPDGQQATFPVIFVVASPVPTITHILPGSVPGNSSRTIQIIGKNFNSGDFVAGQFPWSPSILATYVSPQELDLVVGGPQTSTAYLLLPIFFSVSDTDFQNSNLAQLFLNATLPTMPTISSVDPTHAVAGGSDFTLKVMGDHFIAGSTVTWNNTDLATTFVNATELDAVVPAADIASIGINSITVIVGGPGPENVSAITPYPVLATTRPIISSVSPYLTILAGSPDFTLHVLGSNFVSGATVTWNGSNRVTTFVNAGEVDAAILAADVFQVGIDSVTVINPDTQMSDIQLFPVRPALPAPAITGITPPGALVGSGGLTLQVFGHNFVSGATVTWNNANRPTTFINTGELDVSIPATDVATAAIDSVTVVNPDAQPSGIWWFYVPPPPLILALTPNRVNVGSLALTLKVSGNYFTSGAIVTWNGSNRPTTYVSEQELDASISATDLATAGFYLVDVINPDGQKFNDYSGSMGVAVQGPAPVITHMLPGAVPPTNAAVTLKIIGSGFLPGAVIQGFGNTTSIPPIFWNGTLLATFVSAQELDVQIQPFSPSSPPLNVPGNYNLRVFNPDLQISNTKVFNVGFSAAPTPVISGLQPSFAVAGGPDFLLKVTGTNFVSGATITWNNSDLSTTLVNPNELDALVPLADIASVGIDSITVIEGAPLAEQGSAVALFPVLASAPQVPLIGSLQPGTTTAGSPDFTLRVLGSHFVSGATVTWNTSNRPTTFVSANELDASISAADIATVAINNVSVVNPYDQVSNIQTLAVTPPVPAAPTNVLLSNPQQTSLDLGWTSSVGATGYRIDVSVISDFSTFVTGYQDKDLGNVTSFTITSLASATPYFVRLRAYNAVGSSADAVSSPASLSTLSAPDPGPLPEPDLGGIPDVITVHDRIQVNYSSHYAIRFFHWSIQAQTPSGSTGASHVFGSAASATFPTSGPQADLASLDLSPGVYTISVQAEGANGSLSPQASKTVTMVSADLSGIRVYPDPWQINLYQGHPLTFDHLPLGSTVKIFTIAGHWVVTLPSINGVAAWTDLKNDSGDTVATGIYYYLVTDPQGHKAHGKFGIVR